MITTPEQLAMLVEALERAWSEIAPAVEPEKTPAERERLARIIAMLWSEDPAADLVSLSVARYRAPVANDP
jgi:hypothetical protein